MDAPAAPNLDDITGGIDRDLSISPNSSPVPGNRGRGAAIGAGSTTQPHVEAHYHTLETPCTAQQHASDLAAVAPASLAKSLPQNVGQQGRVVPQQPQHVVAHSRTGSFRSTAALESSVSGGARICQVAAGHQLGANATPNCDAELLDGPLPEGVADGVQENVTPLVGQRFTEPTESSAEQDVAGSSASDTGSNSVKSQSSGASHCGGSAHSDLTDLLPAATTGRPGHEAEEESEDVKDLVHKLQLLQSGKQMDILKKLLDGNPELRQALATLGDTASSSTSTSASSGKEQKKFRCTKCEKLFSRQCELR